ncbi:hypothetical protein [Prosthecobacter sp.]|uniref:hypothetical protein n=1 Tax=Prosthecobacter sp. TaxID=1965333 RepID=UPI00378356BE
MEAIQSWLGFGALESIILGMLGVVVALFWMMCGRAVRWRWLGVISVMLLGTVVRGEEVWMRGGGHASVKAFMAAGRAFVPSATPGSDLAGLFAVPEMGEVKRGKPVPARSVQECTELWANEECALVLAVAFPPTEATKSCVGVLFLLRRQEGLWRIADLRRFSATGKLARVEAEQTAHAGSGYALGREGMRPVVTVKQWDGGRGYSYGMSSSYTVSGWKLVRMEPE